MSSILLVAASEYQTEKFRTDFKIPITTDLNSGLLYQISIYITMQIVRMYQ